MHDCSKMFPYFLLILVIGFGVFSFFVICNLKRYLLQKREKYDSWLDEQVKQGLREEHNGKMISQARIKKIFDTYIK